MSQTAFANNTYQTAGGLTTAQLVRQQTYASNRLPGVFYGLKALFLSLAANQGNPNLFLWNIDGTYSSSDGGNNASQVVSSVACHLYAIYLYKNGTTVTWFKATDNATTATTNGGQNIQQAMTTAKDQYLFTYPTGFALANGLTITENTTATGSTLTVKANNITGFIILGL